MSEVLKFCLVGGISALLNWSSRFLFSICVSYEVAVTFAFFVGLVAGFLLMRTFVFQKSEKSIYHQTIYFLVVNMFALLITWTLSVYLAKVFFPSVGIERGAEGVAHLIGISAPIITSYFGHKYLTFK